MGLLTQIQDEISWALQADLEHGVAWMNEAASVEFANKYPDLCQAFEWLFNLEEDDGTTE